MHKTPIQMGEMNGTYEVFNVLTIEAAIALTLTPAFRSSSVSFSPWLFSQKLKQLKIFV